jgi:hypothetical protein
MPKEKKKDSRPNLWENLKRLISGDAFDEVMGIKRKKDKKPKPKGLKKKD